MSYNDKQQNNEHLLIWLNSERLHLGERFKFYTLNQIQTSNILPLLLLKIQPFFFSSVNRADYDFSKYLLLIEKYLLQVEDLKIKRRYRQELFLNQSLSEIIKLVLFLVMRSEKKQQFVGRILELQEQVQVQLMNQLKKIQNSLENNMEIKQFFCKIQELQEQNQQFYSKLKEVQFQQKNVEIAKKIAKEENQRLIQIQRKNLQEKSHFMQDLGVIVTKDYRTIFKELQNQREAILSLQRLVQESNLNLVQANHQMEQKVIEDKQIIEYLSEEINCYKTSLQQLKKQKKRQTLFRSSTSEKENMKYDTYLSPHLTDTRMIKSVEAETTICSFKNVTMIEQEDVGDVMKDYNGDLIAKLQKTYSTISSLNQQINDLKKGNSLLIQKNKQKQRKMRNAQRQFRQFCLNYDFTISG